MARVLALAVRQHRQITHAQLLAAGLTARRIESWAASGRLRAVHHGVYALGPPPMTDHERWMAAVLATGGVLSDRSAAALWAIWTNVRSYEHVIVPRSAKFRHEGLRIHRPRRFDPVDATTVDGITVTRPARTLLDLAGALPARPLADALREARVRGLITDDALRDVLARHPAHRGTRGLGYALTGPFTRSRLERRFLRLVAEHDLPAPVVNVRVGPYEVDAQFGRLVVELDGGQHAGAWAQDARRDAFLRSRGFHVLRLTWWTCTATAPAPRPGSAWRRAT